MTTQKDQRPSSEPIGRAVSAPPPPPPVMQTKNQEDAEGVSADSPPQPPSSSPVSMPRTVPQIQMATAQEAGHTWWQRQSLRTKATVLAIALGIVPVAAIGSLAYGVTSQRVHEQVLREQQFQADAKADLLNQFMLERYADIQKLAHLTILTNPSATAGVPLEQRQAVLDEFIKATGNYDSIAVADLQGNTILQSSGEPVTGLGIRDYFKAAVKTRQPVITPPRKSAISKQYSIFLAAPVFDATTGKMIAVIRSRTPVKLLEALLKDTTIGSQGSTLNHEIFAVDQQGKYFIVGEHPEELGLPVEKDFTTFPRWQSGQQLVTEIYQNQKENIQELVTYVPAGEVKGLPKLGWSVLVAEETTEAFASLDNLRLILLAGSAITALLVGAIAAYLAGRFTRPILEVAATAEKLGQGNLDARVEGMTTGTDELTVLGTNLNQMADQMQTFIQRQETDTLRARLLAEIAQSPTPAQLTGSLNQLLHQVRADLRVDRVVVYRFNLDWSGYVSAESVAPGWFQALADKIEDPCIPQELLESYRQGRVVPTTDVFNAGFHPQHLKLMERLQIKSNLVTPIVAGDQLYGLLVAHHCAQPHVWQSSEIEQLGQFASQIGLSLSRVVSLEQKSLEAKRSQLFAEVTAAKARVSQDLEFVFNRAVTGALDYLQADRVVVYQFNRDWSGFVASEAVLPGWPQALNNTIEDACIPQELRDAYCQGRVVPTKDVFNAGFHPEHLKLMERLQIKANLVTPIVTNNQLYGLLVAHFCSKPHVWQQSEIDFLTQLATLVGLSLDRVSFLQDSEVARQQAEALAKEQQRQKEAIQLQLIDLLSSVEGASRGDLTVRADVTAADIGTVADFFNAIIGSLRKIVVQVQASAQQVSTSVGKNEGAIRQLADQALKQADEITRTLSSVEQMSRSIQTVSDNAKQAATVARQASTTAEAGEVAMDRTVQSILQLRDTVGETSKRVKRLGESSQQISKVVALINQIALQTNLLAINASIEAARAGEEGRGFAVVAEEVGQLAAQSATATKEIEQIVESIQRETSEVVTAMELGTTQVVEGAQLVEGAKQSLEQIVEVSRQIDQLVQAISQATVSQTQTSQSVTTLMKEVARLSEQTSQSSRQASKSLQQTVEVSQQLQSSVGTFKVGSGVGTN
ncbi:methyl-accepting chemotaxis protein [Neosynechococcus sphagnicola]|uniref:methyl-accepting chemotaxis protein n=1 Tax=Neosynechococcus sphagnicola TaxID=1501145 RepID=UPI000689FAA9|nr:methyl-accepting chemotaxis protein [Neosynechococcus sphagnicola]